MGFPFFRPIYMENAALQVHQCPFASQFVETALSRVMEAPFFPVKFGELKATIDYEAACPDTFEIGSVQIVPISLSHPNGGSGYKFTEDGKSFVYLTDNELGFVHPGGLPFDAYREFCADVDFLIHDAEFTAGEYAETIEWGHTVYTDALNLAMDAGVGRFGLFHHNQERTDDQVDAMVDDCRQRIDRAGINMDCFAVGTGASIDL